MPNQPDLNNIRSKLEQTTILTAEEKADWLALLELMNTKQLNELEEILDAKPAGESASKTSAATPPSPKPPADPTLPPLTHLANIPAGVEHTHAVPQRVQQTAPPPPKTTPQPVKPQIKPTPAPTQKITQALVSYNPASPEELKQLTVDDLRKYQPNSVLQVFKNAITSLGYFHILQLFEASPLYEAYIKSGQQRLKGEQSELTQEEFEFITDLLMNMRINRL